MTYNYLTEERPETFPVPGEHVIHVQFNPNKLKFLLLAQPTLEDLRLAIEQYASKRIEDRWAELMQPMATNTYIQAFKVWSKKLVCVAQDPVQMLMGESEFQPFFRRIRAMSIDEQRVFIQPLKPKSVAEMLALYRDTKGNDMTGYR